MKKALLIISVIIVLVVATAAVFVIDFYCGYEIYRDVSYGSLECEIMDIYIPDSADERENNGCVLFIHGGSWSGGDKAEEALRCRNLANHGYVAATMNYTLYSDENAGSYCVDTVLEEIAAALEMIKSFTAEKGITVNKAATSGYSAGAHLSMLYSFSRGETSPIEIEFTANMAGPADLSLDIWGETLGVRIGEMLSGKTISEKMIANGEAEKILESLSPVTYVNSDTPPSIFVYGGMDTIVSLENGEALKERFECEGIKHEYIFLPDSDHSLMQNVLKRLSYSTTLIDYCREYFD